MSLRMATMLDATTGDTLLAIACALPTSTDLLRLALTCRCCSPALVYFTTTSYGTSAVCA
jgi:hypothetical protein